MHLRALVLIAGLGLSSLTPAGATDNRAEPNNPNVKRAMKRAKKVRPTKYKAPKKNRKPSRARYGVKHT